MSADSRFVPDSLGEGDSREFGLPLTAEVRALLDQVFADDFAALERACEAALTGGEHGVLVDASGSRVHPDVPYGTLHVVVELR